LGGFLYGKNINPLTQRCSSHNKPETSQNVSIDASMNPILQSDKDDCLFISYDELIEPIIENQGLKWYAGFYIQTN